MCDMAKIFVAGDNDIDNLISEATTRLAAELRAAIDQQQRCLASIEDGKSDLPSIGDVASGFIAAMMSLATLQTLKTVKTVITSQPPSFVYGKQHVQEWLANDRPYDYMAVTTAIMELKKAHFLRLWRLPKQGNCCRYKFMKSPAEFPMEYRVFRKIGNYFFLTLGDGETSMVVDWDRARTNVVSGLNDLLNMPRSQREP